MNIYKILNNLMKKLMIQKTLIYLRKIHLMINTILKIKIKMKMEF